MFVYLAILLNATYKSSFCNVVAKRAFRTKVLVRRMRRINFYVRIIFLSSAKIIEMRSPTLQPNLVLPSFRRREKSWFEFVAVPSDDATAGARTDKWRKSLLYVFVRRQIFSLS